MNVLAKLPPVFCCAMGKGPGYIGIRLVLCDGERICERATAYGGTSLGPDITSSLTDAQRDQVFGEWAALKAAGALEVRIAEPHTDETRRAPTRSRRRRRT